MKKIIVILILSSCAAFAQEDNLFKDDSLSYNVFKETVPFWRMERNLKFSPFDIFSAVSTIGADLEMVLKPGLSFQYGAAIIPSFLQFTVGDQQQQFNWMNGYRLRFESRFSGFKRKRLYTSTELSFRHLIINDQASIGMEGDGNGNFAYFIVNETTFNRFSTQFNIRLGFQYVFKNRFVLDFFGGFSFRYNFVFASESTIPEDGEVQFNWNRLEWNLTDGNAFGYAVPITGIRLGLNWPAKADI